MKPAGNGGSYRIDEIKDAKLSVVDAGSGKIFLVASGVLSYPKTVILSWVKSSAFWVEVASREEILDPELAVSGYLFGSNRNQNPIEALEKRLDSCSKENFKLISEKIVLMKNARRSKKPR